MEGRYHALPPIANLRTSYVFVMLTDSRAIIPSEVEDKQRYPAIAERGKLFLRRPEVDGYPKIALFSHV
jgi:hypothetical protein